MPTIRYNQPLNVLVAAKGHPYLRDPFMAVFDTLPGIACTLVEQPAAALLMNPDGMARFNALVLYDMPGLDFEADPRPGYVEPTPAFKAGFEALLRQGKGIVALHHAIAGWPAWPQYGEWLGGRFLYRPGEVRGERRLDSGYRHEVTYEAATVREHPVLAGLPPRFLMTDELYLSEVFEADVTPLLRADHAFTRELFFSATAAVSGRMYDNTGWDHPPGSNLIGWTKRAINSPLVYLQPGDGPETYAHPHYRRLVENAIRWVCTEGARATLDKAAEIP